MNQSEKETTSTGSGEKIVGTWPKRSIVNFIKDIKQYDLKKKKSRKKMA